MDQHFAEMILSEKCLASLDSSTRRQIKKELLKHIKLLSTTAKELDVDIDQLLNVHITKHKYNQLDLREKRHIYQNDDQKKQSIQMKNNLAKEKYMYECSLEPVNVYDIVTNKHRPLDYGKEFSLGIFTDKNSVEKLLSLVPSYIKIAMLKCSNLYLIDIPNKCVSKFSGSQIIVVPKRKTVILAIDSYSTQISNILMYKLCTLKICFIDADTAERIDDEYPYKFWFYENYNPKRKYHCIYSNSRNNRKL